MVLHDGTVLALPEYEPALEALLAPERAAEVRAGQAPHRRAGGRGAGLILAAVLGRWRSRSPLDPKAAVGRHRGSVPPALRDSANAHSRNRSAVCVGPLKMPCVQLGQIVGAN